MSLHSILLASPIGELFAISDETALYLLEFSDSKTLEKKIQKLEKVLGKKITTGAHPLFERLEQELSEYFSGTRKKFTLPLSPMGTKFQRKAWEALRKIPYGETRNYQEEAMLVENPKAVRAIGGANNKNPIVILIPCHRVIGKSGNLVGYGGGLERKKYLLHLEDQVN